MKLPSKLSMKELAHGHGERGMAFYTYEDTEGFGVVMEARREAGARLFIETYRFAWLPHQVYGSYSALCAALEALTDEQVAAEKALWPQMREPIREDRGQVGGCWIHPDQPATHFGSALTCWIAARAAHAMLCEACAAEAGPAVIMRASEARRAQVAARRASLLPLAEGLQ